MPEDHAFLWLMFSSIFISGSFNSRRVGKQGARGARAHTGLYYISFCYLSRFSLTCQRKLKFSTLVIELVLDFSLQTTCILFEIRVAMGRVWGR